MKSGWKKKEKENWKKEEGRRKKMSKNEKEKVRGEKTLTNFGLDTCKLTLKK